MEPVKLIYVTCKDPAEARTIGKILVQEKLAACVNILPQMESIYIWQDAIETANESVLVIKSRSSLMDKCADRIKSLHSYSVPCILELTVSGGSAEYISWIKNHTLAD